MEERTQWRIAIVLSVISLLLACCHRIAGAEERVLPPGTEVQLPRDGERIVLDETHFLVERSSVDEANASAEMERRLTSDLMKCSATLKEATRPEPTWKTAIRWTSIGIAVGAAFGLGLYLG